MAGKRGAEEQGGAGAKAAKLEQDGDASGDDFLKQLAEMNWSGESADGDLVAELEAMAEQPADGEEGGVASGADDQAPGADAPPDLSFGYVKTTHPEKGFSFLVTDPNDESTKVYVHHTVCDPMTLQSAHAVAFRTHFNAKGEAQASAPVWLLLGSFRSDAVAWCEHAGKVRQVLNKGCAFIECESVKSQHGREAWCHESVVAKAGLAEGEAIRFDVHLNKEGMPQVKLPVWKMHDQRSSLKGKGGKDGGKGGGKFGGKSGGKYGGKDWAWDGGMMALGGPAQWAGPEEPIHLGKVRSLDAAWGTAAIACDSSGAAADVVVSQDLADLSSLEEGSAVAFPISGWGADGSPQAGAPFWKCVGEREAWKMPVFGEFVGTISRVMPNGCGFVECEAAKAMHGKEVYIHSEVLNQCGLAVGDGICFSVHVNNRGMPQVSCPCFKKVSYEELAGPGGKGKGASMWSSKGGKGCKGGACSKGKGGKGGKGDPWSGGGWGAQSWTSSWSGVKQGVEGGMPAAFRRRQ